MGKGITVHGYDCELGIHYACVSDNFVNLLIIQNLIHNTSLLRRLVSNVWQPSWKQVDSYIYENLIKSYDVIV